MDINIEWQEPIQLTRNYDIIIDENKLPESIEDEAGVYFFSRKFGEYYEPFYIGETLRLQKRLGQHLKTKQLAFVLKRMNEKIKNGERYFHFGYFIGKPGQDAKKCIRRAKISCTRGGCAGGYSIECATDCLQAEHDNFFWNRKSSRHFRQEEGYC